MPVPTSDVLFAKGLNLDTVTQQQAPAASSVMSVSGSIVRLLQATGAAIAVTLPTPANNPYCPSVLMVINESTVATSTYTLSTVNGTTFSLAVQTAVMLVWNGQAATPSWYSLKG